MLRALLIVLLFLKGVTVITVGFLVNLLFGNSRRLVLIGALLSRVLNVAAGPLMNKILRTKGPKFGSAKDTTSKILGGVKLAGGLTWYGKLIVHLLHIADPNHCVKEWERESKGSQQVLP
jgi:hypothetical protein